jgi:DNA-binding FrmR family transcriptional regulator
MTQSPLTREQAEQLLQQLRQAQLGFAALRKAMEDAGLEMPEDVRQQLMAVRQQIRIHGVPGELIDTMPGLEPPADG